VPPGLELRGERRGARGAARRRPSRSSRARTTRGEPVAVRPPLRSRRELARVRARRRAPRVRGAAAGAARHERPEHEHRHRHGRSQEHGAGERDPGDRDRGHAERLGHAVRACGEVRASARGGPIEAASCRRHFVQPHAHDLAGAADSLAAALDLDPGELQLGDDAGGELDARVAQLFVADGPARGRPQRLEHDRLLTLERLERAVSVAGAMGALPAQRSILGV
jgi:hypothetical protein